MFSKRKITLVANTKKAALRFAVLAGTPSRTFKLSTQEEQRYFAEHFPLGQKMNDTTYVFSSTIFANKNGQARLFMAALPVDVCDELAYAGAEKYGSIHRIAAIDCIEHILLRKYSENFAPDENVFIFLPQDNGLRVLYIKENLPTGAVFISNHPDYREVEFMRFYNTLEKSETQRAILINFDESFLWLQEILTTQNILHEEAQHTE